MDIITGYIQKFMSEAQESIDELAGELDKIKDAINASTEDAFEFEVSFIAHGETGSFDDPHFVEDEVTGILDIWKEGNSWAWESSNPHVFVLDGRGSGFASLEECLKSIHNWAEDFEDFEVSI
jgi:hypothetical protein